MFLLGTMTAMAGGIPVAPIPGAPELLMARSELSNEQYERHRAPCPREWQSERLYRGRAALGVFCLTPKGALTFANEASKAEGLRPAYVFHEDGSVTWDRSSDGYRLLTLKEWRHLLGGPDFSVRLLPAYLNTENTLLEDRHGFFGVQNNYPELLWSAEGDTSPMPVGVAVRTYCDPPTEAGYCFQDIPSMDAEVPRLNVRLVRSRRGNQRRSRGRSRK